MFQIQDFWKYPVPTRHDTQFTLQISFWFQSPDCIIEVSWYDYWIDVNCNREDFVCIPEAHLPEMCRNTWEGEIVWNGQLQIADATRRGKYTQSRLTVAETIPSWFQRPISRQMRQWPSGSKSNTTDSYKNSKAIDRAINEIRSATFRLNQLMITGTILERMHP